MKKMSKKIVGLCVLWAAGVCLASEVNGLPRSAFEPDAWQAVSDDQLGDMRGGFDVGGGLAVSFGMVRSVLVNGELISQTHIELPNLSHITADLASSVASVLASAGVVQNGMGNFLADTMGLGTTFSMGTVVQNTLNDQQLQTFTVINAGVNTLGLFRSMYSEIALHDALVGSLGVR